MKLNVTTTPTRCYEGERMHAGKARISIGRPARFNKKSRHEGWRISPIAEALGVVEVKEL